MNFSTASGDVLTALRAATGQAHHQLEAAIEIESCVADLEKYSKLLRGFLGFYRPLEDRLLALGSWVTRGLELTDRRKVPWLVSDLHALNLGMETVEALPSCIKLPVINNHAQAFGCLYVLEGATLGGRQITALLQSSPIPVGARRFFNSYGAETGTRWHEFVVSLQKEAQAVGEMGRAEIVTAAQQTFTCLQEWIVEEC